MARRERKRNSVSERDVCRGGKSAYRWALIEEMLSSEKRWRALKLIVKEI